MSRFVIISTQRLATDTKYISIDTFMEYVTGQNPLFRTLRFIDKKEKNPVYFHLVKTMNLEQFNAVIEEYKGPLWHEVIAGSMRGRLSPEVRDFYK